MRGGEGRGQRRGREGRGEDGTGRGEEGRGELAGEEKFLGRQQRQRSSIGVFGALLFCTQVMATI